MNNFRPIDWECDLVLNIYFINNNNQKDSIVIYIKNKKMDKLNKELLNELQGITNEAVVKKRKGKTFNQRIVDELKDGQPVERYELITRIAMARAIDEGKELNPKDPEFVKYFKKLSITCRNGVDTSLAEGHTNSNFSYNPEFNTKWELIKEGSMISLKAIK